MSKLRGPEGGLKESKADQIRALRERGASAPLFTKLIVDKEEKAPAVRKPLAKPRVSLDTVREPSNDGADTGTKPEWPARVKALGLSLAKFGRLTGTPYQTLKDQANGKARTPGLLFVTLMLLEADPLNMMRLRNGGPAETV